MWKSSRLGAASAILCAPKNNYASGRWRKLKSIATVKLENGNIHTAEVHWYEAHGIGKRKRFIRFLQMTP